MLTSNYIYIYRVLIFLHWLFSQAAKQEAKREAEAKLKEELEEKRKLAEERMKPKGRSFKITKKSDSEKVSGSVSYVFVLRSIDRYKADI